MYHLIGTSLLMCLFVATGVIAYQYEERVVNGTDAAPAEFPFIVSLRRTLGGTHICAGTIIDDLWILTAAHCFTYIKNPKDIFIQYGSIELNPHAEKRSVEVEEIRIHDGYNPTVIIHDIALLRLRKPLQFDENVKQVQLPEVIHKFHGGEGVKLTGWGLNGTSAELQDILKKVDLQIVSNTDCHIQLRSAIHISNLCAGSALKTFTGQCSGDSGGPLLHQGIQFGIVSWSLKPCGRKPGVFTNVSYYLEWISKVIKLNLKFKKVIKFLLLNK